MLTDAKTAGGCEIIAAALRHHGRAKIIGTPTFGRGTIQNIVTMAYLTALVLTIQEIILPDGSSLLQKPIQPDIIVTADKDALRAARQLTGS
ncbi:MAG: S41 family peptidase [Turneriella sp.]